VFLRLGPEEGKEKRNGGRGGGGGHAALLSAPFGEGRRRGGGKEKEGGGKKNCPREDIGPKKRKKQFSREQRCSEERGRRTGRLGVLFDEEKKGKGESSEDDRGEDLQTFAEKRRVAITRKDQLKREKNA